MKKQIKMHENHARPVTRREFMAQGLLSGFAVSMVPGILYSMLRPEFAAAQASGQGCPISAPDAGMVPFLVVDLVGGLGLPSNFVVGKTGGSLDYLTSYETHGVASSFHPASLSGGPDVRFGAPFHGGGLSKVFQGLTTVMSPDAQNRTKMITFCHEAQDDTRANPLNPLLLVARAGLRGTVLPVGLGTYSNGPAGGYSTSPIMDASLKPFVITKGADLTGVLGMGNALGNLPLSAKQKIATAAKNLSAGQYSKFQSMSQGDQLSYLAGCGYLKAIDLIGGVGQLNASANTHVQAVYGSDASGARACAVYHTLMGNTGPSSIHIEGCDYHGQGLNAGNQKDLEVGREVGRAIELAKRLVKPLVIAIITDGGIGYNSDRAPISDSSIRGLSVMAYYHPTNVPVVSKSQIGAYTNGQGVDTSFFFAQNPSLVAYSLFANYLKICNQLSKFGTIVSPGAFPSAELNNVIGFG